MSAAAAARTGRFYTSARRHPWVLGKVADWKIPLGPYTPAQIAVAVGGGFLLIKTIDWWSWMGPVPIAGWGLAVWMVRRPKVRGRAPMQAALGWVLLGRQPRGGRIGGRAAHDRAAHPLLGGFTIEETAPAVPAKAAPLADQPAADHSAHQGPTTAPSARPRPAPPKRDVSVGPVSAGTVSAGPVSAGTVSAGPVSGVRQLLALAEQAGGAR